MLVVIRSPNNLTFPGLANRKAQTGIFLAIPPAMRLYLAVWQRLLVIAGLLVFAVCAPGAAKAYLRLAHPGPAIVQLPPDVVPPNRMQLQLAQSPPRLDVNSADAAALENLPGLGPVLAARIVAYRKRFGPFANAEELIQVRGIGPRSFAKLRDLVCAVRPEGGSNQ